MLNHTFEQALPDINEFYASPLVYSLRKKQAGEGECWRDLLAMGADPTLHDQTMNPIMLAIENRNRCFLESAAFDPLGIFHGFRGEFSMNTGYSLPRENPEHTLRQCSASYEKEWRRKVRADGSYDTFVPLRFAMEEGWDEGALVLVEKAAGKPEFDPNLSWSAKAFFESDVDRGIVRFQFADTVGRGLPDAGDVLSSKAYGFDFSRMWNSRNFYWQETGPRRNRKTVMSLSYPRGWELPDGAYPPQSMLYRAAFGGMHSVVVRLAELGGDVRRLNDAGQSLLHAVVYGAVNEGEVCVMYSRAADAIATGAAAAELLAVGASSDFAQRMATLRAESLPVIPDEKKSFRLELAAAYEDASDFLLGHGVDPRAEDAFGVAPMDMLATKREVLGACWPMLVRSVKGNLRLRRTVAVLMRAVGLVGNPFHHLGADVLEGVLLALHPNFRRACNLPERAALAGAK